MGKINKQIQAFAKDLVQGLSGGQDGKTKVDELTLKRARALVVHETQAFLTRLGIVVRTDEKGNETLSLISKPMEG